MSDKLNFATTINEFGSHGVKSAGDCHNFGITFGCQSECPAFQRGDCKDVFYENLMSEDFIDDLDEEDFLQYLIIYESKLSDDEISILIDNYLY